MKNVLSWLLFLVCWCSSTANVLSQCGGCDSLVQSIDDGGYRVSPYNSADSTVDTNVQVLPSTFCPSYSYEYETDSTHIFWAFSEFLMNGRKLFLSNWCRDSIHNYDLAGDSVILQLTQSQMNEKSATRPFSVSTGDTIGFYRFQWFSRRGYSGACFNYYKNPDVLSYSVVLIDSSDGTRLATLDSAIWNATSPSRKPCFDSWYPMYSRIRYQIPQGITNKTVFIRLNTYATGSATQPWVRQDRLYEFYSVDYLTKPSIVAYCDSVEANNCAPSTTCDLIVWTTPTAIQVSVSTPTAITEVNIYDVFGGLQWSSNVPLSNNPTSVSVSSGLYIVVGRDNNGAVLCTKKLHT